MSTPSSLSVIIPAFDEAERLPPGLRAIGAYLEARGEPCELIVVDDGSGDGTARVAASVAESLSIPTRVLRSERNRGKGHALKVGFAAARGDRILFSDADLSTPIEQADALLAALDEGADVVIGSRKRPGAEVVVHQPWLREQLGKVFTWTVQALLARVSDVTCGFKAFRGDAGRDLFSRVRVFDWSFDAEVLSLAQRDGYRIGEVPVRWEDRAGTRVRLGRDVLGSLRGIAQIRWNLLRGRYAEPCPIPESVSVVWESGRELPPVVASDAHVERQRQFYAERTHAHLQASQDDLYSKKLAQGLGARLGIEPGDRVLEVGAGFGRFTFHLLDQGASVVALDLSERALEDLDRVREERGISRERCRTLCADVQDPSVLAGEHFDHVLGFFILHHLADANAAIAALAPRVAPAGRMGFLEPNRRNPLFALQVMCCPDMPLREEIGMFKLSGAGVLRGLGAAGLEHLNLQRFGFFPPPIFNRLPSARRLEDRLESLAWLGGVLPFLVISGRAPIANEAAAETGERSAVS